MIRDLTIAVVSAIFAGALMTLGDYVWASRLLPHRMVFGLVHGAGLCLALGAALGLPAKRPLIGAIGGLVVGLLAAASYYVLAPFLRYWAMLGSWFVLWVLLALLHRMLSRASSFGVALVRGIVAALGSGLAFYAISGMWTRWNPADINYADHFLRWSFAFLPGFLALHLGSRARAR